MHFSSGLNLKDFTLNNLPINPISRLLNSVKEDYRRYLANFRIRRQAVAPGKRPDCVTFKTRLASQRGQSMMLVAAFMSVLLLLPVALSALAIGEIGNANQSVIKNAALAAAEAGLADYISSLNNSAGSSGYQTLNAGNSTYPAFGGNSGAAQWEPVAGSQNECFFYETTGASSSNVTVTVTGRSGPANNSANSCVTRSRVSYQFRTIAVALTANQNNPYLYQDEYSVANPFVYGQLSGGVKTCGYYAYSSNPNWGFMWTGATIFASMDTDRDLPADPDDGILDFGDWDSILPADTHSTVALGGVAQTGSAFGPSAAGAIGASGPGHEYYWNNGGGILGINFAFNGNAYPNTQFYNENTPFTYPPESWNTSYNALGNTTNGPSGCQSFGSPFHDGMMTNSDTFNGGSGATQPKVYSTDEYYVCSPYPSISGSPDPAGPAFSNVSLLSGDPYTSASAPPIPFYEQTPNVMSFFYGLPWIWQLLIGRQSIYISFQAKHPWQTGPPYWVAPFSETLQGQMNLNIRTWFLSNTSTISASPSDVQFCDPNTPMPTIAQVPTVHPPFTTPSGPSAAPDYTLSSVMSAAASNGGCVYSGNTSIIFTGGVGAAVTLGSGSSVVSGGGSCVGSSVSPPSKVFFVENGNAFTAGNVNGKYTVAVASTSPNLVSLPGSPSFPYPVVGSYSSFNITNNPGPAAGFSGASNTYPDSIYIMGNITYAGSGCAPTVTAACTDYLGLLSQNDVVISYPTMQPNSEGADTDGTWVAYNCVPDWQDCALGIDPSTDKDGSDPKYLGKLCNTNGVDTDGDQSCQVSSGPPSLIEVPSSPYTCDSDDTANNSTGWRCEELSSKPDTDYDKRIKATTVPDKDRVDNESDSMYAGKTCTVGGASPDPDGQYGSTVSGYDDGYCQGDAPQGFDFDSDDTGHSETEEVDGPSSQVIHTIDASIDAVWGSLLLDNYAYFSNADHSCLMGKFYFGEGLYDEPSDEYSPTSVGGSCSSDNDGDESTIGDLTINGSVAQFWTGILTHFDAYMGQYITSGGYAKVNYNYDGRFMTQVPPDMGMGTNADWQATTTIGEASICPTGNTNSSGMEESTGCP